MLRGFQIFSFATVFFIASAGIYGQPLDNSRTLEMAEDLYQHTQYDESLATLDKRTTDPRVNYLIGRDYFMLGDFKKASDYLTKATVGEPSNSDYMDWLGRAYGKRAEMSNPFLAPGYASKARQAFEKSVQLNDGNKEALSDLFDYYLEAPGILGGGYDKAATIAKKIAAVNPAEGYYAAAQLAKKRREFQTAEEHLRQAIALAPKQVGRVLDLAKFLANEGRISESDAVFLQAEKMAPNAPKVWFARADTLIKENRNLEEARALLQKYMQAPITVEDPPRSEAAHLLKQVDGA